MAAPRRVLMYSHDGFGLGHLRRNLNIATGLLARVHDGSVLLVAGLPGIPGFELPDGADLLKLPSLRKVDTDAWQPRSLRVERERLGRMRRALLEAAVESYEPDLVLVDYMPAGVWSELVPTLERLRSSGRARVVLGLRDILDAPDLTRRSWRLSGHADALSRLYDHVLVYGDRSVFDAEEAYGLDALLPGRVEHVGYIVPPTLTFDRAGARRQLGLGPDEKLVLVTAGGGCDARPLMDLALAGLPLVATSGRLRVHVVTGPLMDPEDVALLECHAAASEAIVRRTTNEMPQLLAASDLVVTMGAYNTLMEAVALGRPVVSLPRVGPSAEQGMRARLFEDRGLLRRLPQGATPQAFATAASAALRDDAVPRGLPALDGLPRTIDRLVALLAGDGSESEAASPRTEVAGRAPEPPAAAERVNRG